MNHSPRTLSFPALLPIAAAAFCLIPASFPLAGAEETGDVTHPEFLDEQIGFFTEKIRPILQENCFRCHGGTGSDGEVKVRSGLQLISRKGLILGGDHGSVFNPESPESSLLLEMVSYKDEHHEMPPTGKLEPDQLAALKDWVEMKMPWTPEDIDRLADVPEADEVKTKINAFTRGFWSNKPVTEPPVPDIDNDKWQQQPIDAFIYAKLAEHGLQPNGRAPKDSLIRRAYYNLTGLPPTPEAVAAFVADDSPDAWPKLIDELLESPHYGEHWARHWLDLMRYAESNGFERDSTKEHIWRYRDYVVAAFNSDKPYNQFIIEQIAGDEVDKPTPETLIATGYHRLMQWDDEPADREQHVYDVLDDNVRVTSEGMLAMTLGCARCHDHKGDPIPQKDYYSFMAFFKGVTQMDKTRVIQPVDLPAEETVIAARRNAREKEIMRLQQGVAKIRAELRQQFVAKWPAFEAKLNSSEDKVLVSSATTGMGQLWRYTTDKPADEWFAVGFRPPSSWKSGKAGVGSGAEKENSIIGTNVAFSEIWMQTAFSLTEVPGNLQLSILSEDPAEVYLNGTLIHTADGNGKESASLSIDGDGLAALQTGRNVVAVHSKNADGTCYLDVDLRTSRADALLDHWIATRSGVIENKNLLQRLKRNTERLEELRAEPIEEGVMVMSVQERGRNPGEMFVHIRGSVHAPGDEVKPGVPQILDEGKIIAIAATEPDAKSSGRRIELAKWIADPDNRRTSRVMANRVWQHHFGRGICPTPSDFGYLGELPTHPELLDWLAREFTDNNWSIKHLQRTLMLSRTYQMSSSGNPAGLSNDPANQWFWRFPMRRLTAEEIRDSMIVVTGKLNAAIGGKSFYPALDPEVLATSSTKSGKWGTSTADELERRSIYIHIKRSLKPPELEGFDFADTDAPCAARFVTTVPTQALAMLNSRAVNDQAVKLADRLRLEVKDGVRAQVQRALELTLTREISSDQIERGLELIKALQKTHGLTSREALNRFCLVALNLNEFMYLD